MVLLRTKIFGERSLWLMKVLMLIVADHASVEPGTGKLNILGAFRQIQAAHFPVQHHTMYLVIKLGGETGDKPNPHTLFVSFADEDGHELLNISTPFKMPRVNPGIQPEFNAVMEFRDLVFPHPGAYSFAVRVDKEDSATDQTAVHVIQTTPKAQE
jgi:hypothetical protein